MNVFTNTWRRIFPPKTEDPPRTPVKPLNGHTAYELVHRNNVYTHGERVLCNGASGSLYHSPAEMQWYHVQDDGEVKSVAGSDKITRLLTPDVVAADIAPLDTRELPDGLVWTKPTEEEIAADGYRPIAYNESADINPYTGEPYDDKVVEMRTVFNVATATGFGQVAAEPGETMRSVYERAQKLQERVNTEVAETEREAKMRESFLMQQLAANNLNALPESICYMRDDNRNLRFRATYGSGKHRVTKNCANLHDAITTREAFEVAAKKWRVR